MYSWFMSSDIPADLEKALACLQREDPSLQVKTDADTGQVGLIEMFDNPCSEQHLRVLFL